ncbi:MAG: hypothetical protein DELT_02582 [Desulfovibrio sp.]
MDGAAMTASKITPAMIKTLESVQRGEVSHHPAKGMRGANYQSVMACEHRALINRATVGYCLAFHITEAGRKVLKG